MAGTIRSIALAGVILTLAGCAATPAADNYHAAASLVTAPAVGDTATVGVGETMFRAGLYQDVDAIQLSEGVRLGALAAYTVGPGYYVKRGEDERGEFYGLGAVPGSGRVSPGPLAGPFDALMLKRDGEALCAIGSGGGAACRSGVPVRRVKLPGVGQGPVQTLIYMGKARTRVRVGYREFYGGLPRAEFSNDIDYDLTESDIIGYRGARLQILKATNEAVTFKVVRGFGSWSR